MHQIKVIFTAHVLALIITHWFVALSCCSGLFCHVLVDWFCRHGSSPQTVNVPVIQWSPFTSCSSARLVLSPAFVPSSVLDVDARAGGRGGGGTSPMPLRVPSVQRWSLCRWVAHADAARLSSDLCCSRLLTHSVRLLFQNEVRSPEKHFGFISAHQKLQSGVIRWKLTRWKDWSPLEELQTFIYPRIKHDTRRRTNGSLEKKKSSSGAFLMLVCII